jgi:double-stranded uracil-DNA glycosylase
VILPDVLEPGLRVVFCGTAAGKASARVGAYYAGPGNAFWPTLHEVGLTPRRLEPAEFRELPRYGIGLTDMCKVRSGSDAEIGADGFDVARLVAALEENAPAWIAFTSKNAGRAALGRAVEYGRQPERLGPSNAFVLPSPSGAARGYWDIGRWRELAEIVTAESAQNARVS